MPRKKATASKKYTPSSLKYAIVVAAVFLGILAATNMKPAQYPSIPESSTAAAFTFEDRTYTLNGMEVKVENGAYNSPDTAAVSQSVAVMNQTVSNAGTRAAAVVMHAPGGTGLFYYLVGAMRIVGGDTFSEPVLLGDRIKIRSVTVEDPQDDDNGEIVVTYLEHAGTPLAAEPTVEKTVTYSFEDNGNLIEVLH